MARNDALSLSRSRAQKIESHRLIGKAGSGKKRPRHVSHYIRSPPFSLVCSKNSVQCGKCPRSAGESARNLVPHFPVVCTSVSATFFWIWLQSLCPPPLFLRFAHRPMRNHPCLSFHKALRAVLSRRRQANRFFLPRRTEGNTAEERGRRWDDRPDSIFS